MILRAFKMVLEGFLTVSDCGSSSVGGCLPFEHFCKMCSCFTFKFQQTPYLF